MDAFIKKIRSKPQRAKERIIIGVMAVAAPALFVVWYATFSQSPKDSVVSSFQGVGTTVSNSLSNPDYDQVFGDPMSSPSSASSASPDMQTALGDDSAPSANDASGSSNAPLQLTFPMQ